MSERVETVLGWHYPDLRDFEFKLVVHGRLIVKKNHLGVRQFGGHSSIGPDGDYKRWEREAFKQLGAQWSSVFNMAIPADVPLNLCVVTYMPDRRGWPDLSGTYEGPQDVLEVHRSTCDLKKCRRHSGVITNDRQVFGHVGSDRRIDKAAPRAELTITPYRGAVDGMALLPGILELEQQPPQEHLEF